MPIPPDNVAPGDSGHIAAHNNIADALTALTASGALAAQKASNLSDLASPSAARTNLGLGSAATQPSTAFDVAGAASAAQSAAIAASLPTMTQSAVSGTGTLALNTVTAVTAATTATMTLPSATAGALIVVERESASAANVAVTGNIRGVAGTTITLSLANESEMFLAQGGSWWPVAGHKTLGSLQALFASLATASTYTADQYFKSGRPWFDVVAFGADPAGAADSTAAFQACIDAITGAAAPASNSRLAKGPMYIPAGNYKITSDLIIRSVQNFHMIGAGSGIARITPSTTGFTTAALLIDGSLDGVFEGFEIRGDTSEGAAGSTNPGIPAAIRLDWTTAAQRSTSANCFRDIRIRNLNFVTGISLEGNGSRQVDGTILDNVIAGGQQTLGSWSTSGNWQIGIACGNGTFGNNYDHVIRSGGGGGCYYGYKINASGASVYSAQPFGNAVDFYVNPGAQCVISDIQSQNAQRFLVQAAGFSPKPVTVSSVVFNSGYVASDGQVIQLTGGTWQFNGFSCASTLSGSFVPAVIAIAGDGPGRPGVVTLSNVTLNNTLTAGVLPTVSEAQLVVSNYTNYNTTAGTYAVTPLAFYNGSAWVTPGSTTPPDIQWYTTVGSGGGNTWAKPAGAVTTEAFVMSGGGGGGSGRRGAVSTVRCGGGGGSAGAVVHRQFVTSDLTSSVTVTVGDGGAGGLAVTTDDTSGSNGSNGGASSFGAYLTGPAGGAAAGGSATAGAGGNNPLNSGAGTNGAGGSASTTGLAGVGSNPGVLGAPGGPAGGGITNGNVAGNGAAGTYSYLSSTSSTTYGAAGVVDTTTPTTGTSTGIKGAPGGSPGSGAASITTAAQAGASAYANSGAGGAGGGASLNGNNSGAGGKGGSGFVMVISYFQ